MKASQAVKSITPSLTRELFNLAHNYEDVIDLTLGDPDIQPDSRIKTLLTSKLYAIAITPNHIVESSSVIPTIFFAISSFKNKSLRPIALIAFRFAVWIG